jgi:hypothetical protein
VNAVMYLLRAFELRAYYIDATGFIVVHMAGDLDSRRISQFLLYTFQLLKQSDYLEEYVDVLTVPVHFPADLPLPEDLAPAGEDFVLRGHMDDG